LTIRCGSTGSTAYKAGAPGLALAAGLAAALLLGCSTPSSGSESGTDSSGGGGTGTIAEESSLFGASAADPSLVEFSTNDSAYITERGYTLWALKAAAQSPFISREVVLTKTSGSAEAGYGIVFCHHDAGERMLVAMIDAQGEYIVGEALGSTFSAIVPWTSSTYLRRGYNQDNTIELSLDSGARTFSLEINGNVVKSFAAIESDYDLSGDNGYLVVVSPWDSFPGTPVSVNFKEQ